MSHVSLDFVKFLQNFHAQNLFSKVSLVQFTVKNHLVQMLKLPKSKLLWQQFETDRLVTNFASKSFVCDFENFVMIKRKLWQVVDRKPKRLTGVGCGFDFMARQPNQGIVRDCHDSLSRIPSEISNGVQLFEVNLLNACLFCQLSQCGIVKRFIHSYESARQRPLSFKRRNVSLNQQHFQVILIQPENDTVYGQGRAGIFVFKSHF